MWILIWLVCGCLTAFIAHARGLNVGLWALVGFLFGILALPIVALVPAPDKDKTV